MALIELDGVTVAFGHRPLLDAATLRLDAGERVCLIGRNGAGKSTLLRMMSGDLAADAGRVWRQPGLRVARLEQDVPPGGDRTVFAVVAEGLGALGALLGGVQLAGELAGQPRFGGALGGEVPAGHELGEGAIDRFAVMVLLRHR